MEATLLLVDDHAVFRMGLRLLLDEEPDWRVVGEAGDGQLAIQLAQELSPDVVLMDINMPAMDGVEATRRILEESPGTKVIVVSAQGNKRVVKESLQAGAVGYLLKESAPEELVSGLRAVSQGEIFLSDAITDVVVEQYIDQLSAPPDAVELIRITKLQRPQIAQPTIARPRLLTQFEEWRQRSLTLVSAPAGYGKSTLVCQWIENGGYPAAWLSLDEDDNDLRGFLTYLVSAIQMQFPELLQQTSNMLKAPVLPPMPVLVNTLANELASCPQPCILVLDDYHVIVDQGVQDLLSELLRRPPRPLHLVLITRTDPSLDLLKLRAYNQIGEVRAQALGFTLEETATYLEQLSDLSIDPGIVEVLLARTEGWVTGLRLLTFSLANGGIDPANTSTVLPGERYTLDYLIAEALSRQPREIQSWLLKTSILEHFDALLCEALCASPDDDGLPNLDGAAFIAWIMRQNLFTISLDHGRQWYRYHHLFQELLQDQLGNALNAEEISALHARASRWYNKNGSIDEAIRHALAAEDVAYAVRLVEQHRYELMNAERWHHLDRWLSLLPAEIIESSPMLLSTKAWSYQYRTQLAETWATADLAGELLSTASVDSHENSAVRGEIDTLFGLRLFLYGDGEGAITSLERALNTLAPEALGIRSLAAILLGLGYQMTGDFNHGLNVITDALRARSLPADTYQARLLFGLCFLHTVAGDLTGIKQPAIQGLKIAQEADLPQSTIIARHFLGLYHYLRGELPEATQYLEPVVGAPFVVMPLYFAQCSFGLALTYMAQGRIGEAHDVVDSLFAYATEVDDTLQLDMAHAFKVELLLRQNRVGEAAVRARDTSFTGLPPMYYFYVPQLTSVKLLLAQDTDESRGEAALQLERRQEYAQSKHNIRLHIDVLALQALLYAARNEQPAALKSLAESLALAEPGGFIQYYVELGPPMARLLSLLKREGDAKDQVNYIDRILAVLSSSTTSATTLSTSSSVLSATSLPALNPQSSGIDALTARELQVLRLLATELSIDEIASRQMIGIGTVRTHNRSIYSKLDAHSRFEAVTRAQELGLI